MSSGALSVVLKNKISVIYLACLQYYLAPDIFKLHWTCPTSSGVKIKIISEITPNATPDTTPDCPA